MQLVVTGHRPQKLGGFNNHAAHKQIQKAIHKFIEELQPEIVFTGMALGVDQWVAASCVTLNIPFIACLPFKNQHLKWSYPCTQQYNRLLKAAAKIVYVDRQPGYISDKVPPDVYNSAKMMRRNQYMADQMKDGDILLAVCQRWEHSGSKIMINMVENKQKDIVIKHLDPNTIVPGLLPEDDVPF